MVQLGRTPRDIYTDCSVTKATWEDSALSREELNLSVPVNRSHVVLWATGESWELGHVTGSECEEKKKTRIVLESVRYVIKEIILHGN